MIELLIKLPNEWTDEDGHDSIGRIFEQRSSLERLVKERLTDGLIKQIKIPKIEITKEEIKERMLEIMAQNALDNN